MKYLRKTALSLPVIFLVLLLISAPAPAQVGARLYLQPVDSANGTLTVDVVAENVTNLYGAEFRIKYDPAVVSVKDFNAGQNGIQIEPGSLLPVSKGFVVANGVDEAGGVITFAMTLLNPAPAVSGSGPLARVTFNVLQNTPSVIDIEHTKLVAVDLQTIPSEVAGLIIGNEQQEQTTTVPTGADVPPAAGGSEFPWWIVAAAVLILGILTLAGLIVMGGSKSDSVAPAVSQASVRQPIRPSGSRPSAFKPRTFH